MDNILRKLAFEAPDGLKTFVPICFDGRPNSIALSVREYLGEPIRQDAELAHEERQVLRRNKFEITHRRKLSHPRSQLQCQLEVFVLVDVVGEC